MCWWYIYNTCNLQVVKKEYSPQRGAHEGPEYRIEFESDRITLDIPIEGIVLPEGWKIIPLITPVVCTCTCNKSAQADVHDTFFLFQIMKRHVDSFEPGKMIPKCYLSADFIASVRDRPQLVHQIHLIGAKEPFNMFFIKINPATQPIPRSSQALDTTLGRQTRLSFNIQYKLMQAIYKQQDIIHG